MRLWSSQLFGMRFCTAANHLTTNYYFPRLQRALALPLRNYGQYSDAFLEKKRTTARPGS